ncbi:hypothetical protein MSAN_01368600 [Mycena sanguinolenta]|uniref:Secreted protein n=1 Tax=Mycena sanguinolenta TaxID=230812 RepID=A0A8H6Y5G3_9AGAR|nr:hypothetical protein MSAN_01368600 [Mycena sanguinolenta]
MTSRSSVLVLPLAAMLTLEFAFLLLLGDEYDTAPPHLIQSSRIEISCMSNVSMLATTAQPHTPATRPGCFFEIRYSYYLSLARRPAHIFSRSYSFCALLRSNATPSTSTVLPRADRMVAIFPKYPLGSPCSRPTLQPSFLFLLSIPAADAHHDVNS